MVLGYTREIASTDSYQTKQFVRYGPWYLSYVLGRIDVLLITCPGMGYAHPQNALV